MSWSQKVRSMLDGEKEQGVMEANLIYHITWKGPAAGTNERPEELVLCREIDYAPGKREGVGVVYYINGYRIESLACTLVRPPTPAIFISYVPFQVADNLNLKRVGDTELPLYAAWPFVSPKLTELIEKL